MQFACINWLMTYSAITDHSGGAGVSPQVAFPAEGGVQP